LLEHEVVISGNHDDVTHLQSLQPGATRAIKPWGLHGRPIVGQWADIAGDQ